MGEGVSFGSFFFFFVSRSCVRWCGCECCGVLEAFFFFVFGAWEAAWSSLFVRLSARLSVRLLSFCPVV